MTTLIAGLCSLPDFVRILPRSFVHVSNGRSQSTELAHEPVSAPAPIRSRALSRPLAGLTDEDSARSKHTPRLYLFFDDTSYLGFLFYLIQSLNFLFTSHMLLCFDGI